MSQRPATYARRRSSPSPEFMFSMSPPDPHALYGPSNRGIARDPGALFARARQQSAMASTGRVATIPPPVYSFPSIQRTSQSPVPTTGRRISGAVGGRMVDEPGPSSSSTSHAAPYHAQSQAYPRSRTPPIPGPSSTGRSRGARDAYRTRRPTKIVGFSADEDEGDNDDDGEWDEMDQLGDDLARLSTRFRHGEPSGHRDRERDVQHGTHDTQSRASNTHRQHQRHAPTAHSRASHTPRDTHVSRTSRRLHSPVSPGHAPPSLQGPQHVHAHAYPHSSSHDDFDDYPHVSSSRGRSAPVPVPFSDTNAFALYETRQHGGGTRTGRDGRVGNWGSGRRGYGL